MAHGDEQGRKELLDEIHRLRRRIGELESLNEEHRRFEEELSRAAFYDSVTGLPNRSLFFNHLTSAVALARRNSRPLAVLFLSLDRFKLINDSLGHDLGDLLLKEGALRIRGSLRDSDILSRPGREEFMIMLPELVTPADVLPVVERIFAALAQPVHLDSRQLIVTSSIGIALFPESGDDAESLIRNAYTAMNQAKQEGPNRYRFYSHELHVQAFSRLLMENDLRQALHNDEFFLHYQPQVELAGGRLIGFEALIRWRHGELGMISPGRFIPLAEEIGMIGSIGEWVLRAACGHQQQRRAAGRRPVTYAVNLSPRQFYQKNLLQYVMAMIDENGLDPTQLEFEITESALMHNVEAAQKVMKDFARMGIGIAIDDFGTGYSSLAYLRTFPLTKLKIDKSFVDVIALDSSGLAICQAIVGLSHSLGLRVIAEGVENPHQLELLRSIDCDEVQGFLISKPLPEDETFNFSADYLD